MATSPLTISPIDDQPTLGGFNFDIAPTPRKATHARAPLKNQVKPRSAQSALVPGRQDFTGPFELPADSIRTLPTGSETSASDSSSNDRATNDSIHSSSTIQATSGSASSSSRNGRTSNSFEPASAEQTCAPSPVIADDRFPRQGPSITGSSRAEKYFDSSGSAAAYSAKVSLQRVLSNNGSTSSQVKPKPLLDALSRDTYLEALQNPPVRHRLQQFTQTSLCCDYMSFLDQVSAFIPSGNMTADPLIVGLLP